MHEKKRPFLRFYADKNGLFRLFAAINKYFSKFLKNMLKTVDKVN